MLEIYKNVKKYRKLNGWTQEELAKKIGYNDRSTISKIERGGMDIPQSVIVKLAQVFCISIDELMGSEGAVTYEDQLTYEEQQLIARYRTMSDQEKVMVRRLLGYRDALKGEEEEA